MDGAVSDLIFVHQTVLAGDSFAATFMKIQLLESVDRAVKVCRAASLATAVDDLALQRHGGEKRAMKDIVLAGQVLVNGLAKDSMRIAVEKSQCLASTASLGMSCWRSSLKLPVSSSSSRRET